jgi:hypothetical protein
MIVVKVDQPERAQSLLTAIGCTATREGDRILIPPDGRCEPAQINATLVQGGVAVSHLVRQHLTLEDLFLELTNSPAPEQCGRFPRASTVSG